MAWKKIEGPHFTRPQRLALPAALGWLGNSVGNSDVLRNSDACGMGSSQLGWIISSSHGPLQCEPSLDALSLRSDVISSIKILSLLGAGFCGDLINLGIQ